MRTKALFLAAAALIFTAPQMAMAQAAHGTHKALPCTQCHKVMPPKAPAQETCLACHGSYAQIAQKTAKSTPNPHDSHMGRVECSECHSMHKASRFMCRDCHAFKNVKFKGE
ncbi:MAG: cytochrome c3 family protein [Duodenibacillus sp.]|nr:cytochrome c3 family protein [Duodenibacillus sp.]